MVVPCLPNWEVLDKETHVNVEFEVTVRCINGDVEWVTEYMGPKIRKEAQFLKPLSL